MAAGSWLTHAGGVGKTVAEWMTDGDTEWDVRQMDVNRFHPFQTTPRFIERSATRTTPRSTTSSTPASRSPSPATSGSLRCTDVTRRMGAVFTTFAGLELPNWFEANAEQLSPVSQLDSGADVGGPRCTGRRFKEWSTWRTRENVGLFDLTGLSIIEVAGPDALALVDPLCSNRVDVPSGRVVYTTWLTDGGGSPGSGSGAARRWIASGCSWEKEPGPATSTGCGERRPGMAWRSSTFPTRITAIGLWGPQARMSCREVSDGRPVERGLPIFLCSLDRRRLHQGPGRQDLLRRRTRLGAALPLEFGLAGLGSASGGRRGEGITASRNGGLRLAPIGEGISGLGHRRLHRVQPLRSRSGMDGQARQGAVPGSGGGAGLSQHARREEAVLPHPRRP